MSETDLEFANRANIEAARRYKAQRDDLVKALEECVTILDGAQSGFISGCGSDLAWQKGRDERVAEARRLIAAVKTTEPSND